MSPELRKNLEVNPVIAWNANGEFSSYATERLVAKQINRFRGWWCTAGKNTLYIDEDGHILRGACRVGGVYGNIFGDIRYPKTGTYCDASVCDSSGDILAPKYQQKDLEITYKFKRAVPAAEEVNEPTIITGADLLREGFLFKRVTWSLKQDALRTSEQLMKAVHNIDRYFSQGTKTEYFISVGDLSLQAGLIEMLKFLKGRGHQIVLISNGAGLAEMHGELVKYSNLCFNVELHFFRSYRFPDRIRHIVDFLRSEMQAGFLYGHRVDIKLLTAPGSLSKAVRFARRLFSIQYLEDFGSVRFTPVPLKINSPTLVKYSVAELEYFQRLNATHGQAETILGKFGMKKRELLWSWQSSWRKISKFLPDLGIRTGFVNLLTPFPKLQSKYFFIEYKILNCRSEFEASVIKYWHATEGRKKLYYGLRYKLQNWKPELRAFLVSVVHANPALKNMYYATRHMVMNYFRSQT